MSNPNLQRIVAYLCLIHHNEEAWGSLAEAEGGAVPAEYQPPRRISGGGGCADRRSVARDKRGHHHPGPKPPTGTDPRSPSPRQNPKAASSNDDWRR
jgi:hypothetical protein